MIEYIDNGDAAVYCGYSFRRDKRTNYFLSSKPIRDRRKRLHVYVWECYNGDVPEGYDVHHKDENKLNNELNNLELLLSAEHMKWHKNNLSPEAKAKMAKNLLLNAVPKSKEWHGSEEGRKWHSEHSKASWEARQPISYHCTYCGKPFESINVYNEEQNTFCSNNCKSAFRRKSGFDNIEKTCIICGTKFMSNKYSITKCCSRTCGYKYKTKRKSLV